jgi:hypothetical protein
MALRTQIFAAIVLTGSCLAAGGHPLVYSTFLGGSKNDYASAIDRHGSAYVAGQTSSTAPYVLEPIIARSFIPSREKFVGNSTAERHRKN